MFRMFCFIFSKHSNQINKKWIQQQKKNSDDKFPVQSCEQANLAKCWIAMHNGKLVG